MDTAQVPSYRIGDTIKGSLLIDLLLPPPDLSPNNPESGTYSGFLEPRQLDWSPPAAEQRAEHAANQRSAGL